MATVNMLSVGKYYDNHPVLNEVDLNIEKGEFVVVIGPSGSGKSTLLRLVAGLDSVSSGKILINEVCVNKTPAASRDMAMVFQNYALYPHMSVYDNMAYGLKMRKMRKKDIRTRVEAVAETLQMSDYLYRKPGALSGGQRQRVAMGRAMVRSPAVFLFDEPLSNLDAKLRIDMRHEIKKLHQQFNTTCLYVTHDQTEAMTLADKVVVLNQGRVEQVGAPRVLYQYPATVFVGGFVGHYPMNFFPATLDTKRKIVSTHFGLDLPLPRLSAKPMSDASVIVGIRPEHMSLSAPTDTHPWTVELEFVDDMGADKLVRLIHQTSETRFSVRVSGDTLIEGTTFAVAMDYEYANVFCQTTGQRIGGWNA